MNTETALTVIPETAPVQRDVSPLSVTQVKAGLVAIHEVMRDCMTEGQDYGKVPGCGDKPGLFQPGAQKLSMMFQLNPEVRQETINDYQNFHRGFRLIVRVTSGNKFADGVGECSTLESKYRYRNANRKCPECGKETIYKDKQGAGYYCWAKKGGCGEKFQDPDSIKAIETQDAGKVEHDNPPDFWNTCRKMAFKRAFVHAIINATNTSELWSQDLEDLAANGVIAQPESKEAPKAPPTKQNAPTSQPRPKEQPSSGGVNKATVMFEEFKVVNSKPGVGKPWVLYVCKFATDSGSILECCTFSKELGEKLDTLQGESVDITYQPGRKQGTLELLTINPEDNLP